MGLNVSKNTIKNLVDVAVSVANNVNQNCMQTVNVSNVISFEHSSNITASNWKQIAWATMESNCGTMGSVESEVFGDIVSQVEQTAETLEESTVPNLTDVEADNYVELVTKFATNLSNVFSQECGSNLLVGNLIDVNDVQGAHLKAFDQNAWATSLQTCVQDAFYRARRMGLVLVL